MHTRHMCPWTNVRVGTHTAKYLQNRDAGAARQAKLKLLWQKHQRNQQKIKIECEAGRSAMNTIHHESASNQRHKEPPIDLDHNSQMNAGHLRMLARAWADGRAAAISDAAKNKQTCYTCRHQTMYTYKHTHTYAAERWTNVCVGTWTEEWLENRQSGDVINH